MSTQETFSSRLMDWITGIVDRFLPRKIKWEEIVDNTKSSTLNLLDPKYNDPLVTELSNISKETWKINFSELINKLEKLNSISKYDISKNIAYLKNVWNEKSTISVVFVAYNWWPICSIYLKNSTWELFDQNINFELKK